MLEFGAIHGITKEIRVSLLEDRLHPSIPLPHIHDFYSLVVPTKGDGWQEIDFTRYPIRPFDLFFVKPGQCHDWEMSTNMTGYLVEFIGHAIVRSSNLIMPPRAANQIDDHISLAAVPVAIRAHIFNLFNLIYDEYEGQAPDFEMALVHYLIPMLIQLHRFGRGTSAKVRETDPLLDHFLMLVEENYKTRHEVVFYAKKLKISAKALTMRTTRGIGKSARAVIQERCILEGKRLLAHSQLTISEVGYEIGFEDPSYFSRFFKNSAGKSPGEFRTKRQKTARK